MFLMEVPYECEHEQREMPLCDVVWIGDLNFKNQYLIPLLNLESFSS
jgi:hypothetical protein